MERLLAMSVNLFVNQLQTNSPAILVGETREGKKSIIANQYRQSYELPAASPFSPLLPAHLLSLLNWRYLNEAHFNRQSILSYTVYVISLSVLLTAFYPISFLLCRFTCFCMELNAFLRVGNCVRLYCYYGGYQYPFHIGKYKNCEWHFAISPNVSTDKIMNASNNKTATRRTK